MRTKVILLITTVALGALVIPAVARTGHRHAARHAKMTAAQMARMGSPAMTAAQMAKMRKHQITSAQRRAAARRAARRGVKPRVSAPMKRGARRLRRHAARSARPAAKAPGVKAAATASPTLAAAALSATPAASLAPGAVPDYFGNTPNYANSPLPPTVTLTGGGGTGATAVATVVAGVVTAITPTNGGTGYTSAPAVAIVGLDGTGAAATAAVTGGAVTGFTVTNGGSGYGGIRKFVNQLQLPPEATPIANPAYPGDDYYIIELGQYQQVLSPDLPATTLRGYREIDASGVPMTQYSYLGPTIVAHTGTPVRVKFVNDLPTSTNSKGITGPGADGNLFLPTDTTIAGAGTGPNGGTAQYTQNRSVLHLHGGRTPWISDGTEHQWITPASETTPYPRGVSVRQVPDMTTETNPVDPGHPLCSAADSGCQTFYYTNDQSARLMFYHDHSYGITRLNVYAGEAAAYVLHDSHEQGVLTAIGGATEVPLVIQDKTFVPGDGQLAVEDPTWDKTKWGGLGNLWFPHVYMPNQNPSDITGANAMGRWDYGPWFWPPFTGITNGAVPNPLFGTSPTEGQQNPGTPTPTAVPEAFMDTTLVDGQAYPYMNVGQKAYRFRVLNASNDRTMNLQLYYAAADGKLWDANGKMNPGAGEVPMVPAVAGTPGTAGYPKDITDGRDGGVPDTTKAGPDLLQIGNEGGVLPHLADLNNTPVGYDYNRRAITVLNVSQHTLLLGPAERADVVVDFSQVPVGRTLILYNDAPAPIPAFDPRYDYYTGDPDQTSTGGAPTTLPGYAPNTRTIMQFQVDNSAGTPSAAIDKTALDSAVSTEYGLSQPKPIIPTADYNAAFGTNSPTDNYVRIQDTSHAFFNGPLTGLKLTSGGTGYSSTPNVTITAPGGVGNTTATATAAFTPGFVNAINLTNGGSGYTTVPTVALNGGGGSGATATASITEVLQKITITNGGTGYTSKPTVTLSKGGGSGATATATVAGGQVTAVTVTKPGSGYTSAPTVSFAGGGGRNAAAVATTTRVVSAVTLTNKGTGYSSNPTVAFTGGTGTGAAATATAIPGLITGITLTSGGTGYTSAPTVAFVGGGGSGATATAVGLNMSLQPKSIIENFDADWGRMNGLLGVEVPNTTGLNQTSIPYMDIDPPTEVLKGMDGATQIGTAKDGTQIWKITHNGVDTHSIHWHMFDVQVINRVGWDGAVKPPDANELGWKDTVRMNPLEDVIIALRPIVPKIPTTGAWAGGLPNSIRLMDPTKPAGSTLGFANVDPTNQPAPVTNQLVNFGWEYVWHCHLLGHEENTMMRPMAAAVAPVAPSGLTVTAGNGNRSAMLRWTDNSKDETAFKIERATSQNGPWTAVRTLQSTTGPTTGTTVSFTDTGVSKGTKYWYRVTATDVVGLTVTYTAPAVGYPTESADSDATAPFSIQL